MVQSKVGPEGIVDINVKFGFDIKEDYSIFTFLSRPSDVYSSDFEWCTKEIIDLVLSE